MLESWFNSPRVEITEVQRDADAQAAVDAATSGMSLYHYETCMFCARVRRAMAALNLNIELRDIMNERAHYRDLMTYGGRTTVPCLRIDDAANGTSEWMFESADIIAYLAERFGAAGDAG